MANTNIIKHNLFQGSTYTQVYDIVNKTPRPRVFCSECCQEIRRKHKDNQIAKKLGKTTYMATRAKELLETFEYYFTERDYKNMENQQLDHYPARKLPQKNYCEVTYRIRCICENVSWLYVRANYWSQWRRYDEMLRVTLLQVLSFVTVADGECFKYGFNTLQYKKSMLYDYSRIELMDMIEFYTGFILSQEYAYWCEQYKNNGYNTIN